MSTKQLKEQIVAQLEHTEAEDLLQEVYDLLLHRDKLEQEEHSGLVYKLSDAQRTAIRKGQEQIARGEFSTQQEVDRELDEWFEEKIGMGRKVVWSKEAMLEFKEIASYWNKHNKSSAFSRDLRNTIREKMQDVAVFPGIGNFTDEYGIHKKLVRDYYVFYEVSDTQINVLSIWDTRRNPDEAPYSY